MNEGPPLRFLMSAPDEEADTVGKTVSRVGKGLETFTDPLVHFSTEMGRNRFEQLLHAFHIAVDRPASHTGLDCEIADTHVNGAALGEKAKGGLMDAPLYRIQGFHA